MANPNAGRFVWHELLTTDAAASTKFYEGLFGWNVQEMPMGSLGTYRLFSNGDKQVAGSMPPPAGVPAGWLVYVGSEDPDQSCAKIRELGGKVLTPPVDVPGIVRFSVAVDPQGAAVGVLKGLGATAADPPYEGPPRLGTFCWDELHTKDTSAAGKFYGAVFGWTGKVGADDPMKYWHWMNAGKEIGGMMGLMSPHALPHWLGYVAVADVDASCRKARELGATVVMEPMDVPHVGRFGVVRDPTGATVALFRSAQT
jgi:predicted enzyme related to lactoylglutathione lyase